MSFVDWLQEKVNDDILGTSSIGDAITDPNNPAGQLISLGLANAISDKTKAQIPKVGYQGKVDRLTKVRDRLDIPESPTEGRNVGIMSGEDRMAGDMYQRGAERRPGGKGRRYFTDRVYAKTPEDSLEAPSLEEAREKVRRQKLELEGKTPEEIAEIMGDGGDGMAMGGRVPKYAAGGIAGAHNGYYLGGKTDGMADKVPARIDGKQEARLSDGEFVIPADVVSHLGNGNSDAGAQQLHSMMDNVRTARTGNPEQGKQIDPQQFMPKMAQGGIAQYAGGGNVNAVQGKNSRFKNQPYTTNFDGTGGDSGSGDDYSDPMVGLQTGSESSLSSWAGDYVTDMLSYGRAEAETPYEAYTGPLTAGTSALQNQAYTGFLDLNNPLAGGSITNQMGAFTPDQATAFMNPYEQEVIDRTAADMRRQSQIDALQDRSAMTAAGAFGGSRDALMRAERAGNLSRNIGDMAATQRAQGYTQALDRAQQAQDMTNRYGLDVLAAQAKAGAEQRGIASEGIAADYAQFREERDYDKKAIQYMQSLLQGLPLASQSYSYSEPSALDNLLESQEMLEGLAAIFGYEAPETTPAGEAT